MIDIQSKYDNMYKNDIFYAFIYINNHVIINIFCVLSGGQSNLDHIIIFKDFMLYPVYDILDIL